LSDDHLVFIGIAIVVVGILLFTERVLLHLPLFGAIRVLVERWCDAITIVVRVALPTGDGNTGDGIMVIIRHYEPER
jgi:hypothetical protein